LGKGCCAAKANTELVTKAAFLLGILAKIEEEPSLIGASPHLMCVATKL